MSPRTRRPPKTPLRSRGRGCDASGPLTAAPTSQRDRQGASGEGVGGGAIGGAGGRIARIGMRVDRGNLLALGAVGDIPAVGAPGCARSPKENGFDWVLNRILAGIPVTSDDIAGLGVGGLLTEIATRPQPRAGAAPRIAALLLAAGSTRRMGAPNKLVATIDGIPLVRIAAEAALASHVVSLTVVTGYAPQEIEAALDGLERAVIHNLDFADGLSTSLRAGVASLPADADGVVVLLADMPEVTASIIDRLIERFRPDGILVPTFGGKRGNPVVWPRRFFADLMAASGDTGGRALIESQRGRLHQAEVGAPLSLAIHPP